MPSNAWGAVAVATSYTDNYVQTPGVGLPTGRAMLNGAVGVISTALTAYCSGKGATRSVVLSLGSIATGAFGVAASSSAQSTGWVTTNNVYIAGGSATFTIDMNGSAYFGRNSGSGSSDSYGTAFGVLYGALYWIQAPTAPLTPGVTMLDATTARVTWTAPSDNGESGVTGYMIQTATTASFGAGTTNTTVGAVLTADITGLTPGTTYFFRVCARNLVTTTAGTYGTPSSYVSAKAPSGAYVGDGTAWPVGLVSVGDGAATWETPQVLIGDGTSWLPAG